MRERRHVAARRAQAEQRAFRGGARRRDHVAGRPDGAAGAQPKGVTLPRSASARPQSARSFLEAVAAAPAVTPLSDRTAIALNSASEAALTSFSTEDNVARCDVGGWIGAAGVAALATVSEPHRRRSRRPNRRHLLAAYRVRRLRIADWRALMHSDWAKLPLAAPPGVALRRSGPRRSVMFAGRYILQYSTRPAINNYKQCSTNI